MGISKDYIKEEYNIYKKLYNLEEYFCVFQNVPIQLFEHLCASYYFVIAAPFALDKKHYVIPYITCRLAFHGEYNQESNIPYEQLLLSYTAEILDNGNYILKDNNSTSIKNDGEEKLFFSHNVSDQCVYRLPYSVVDNRVDKSFIETVRRIVYRNLQSDNMAGDILPLAFFLNKFICEDGRIHYHKGIGFSCKLRMTGEKFSEIHSKRGKRLPGIFITITNHDLQHFSHNWDFYIIKNAMNLHSGGPVDEYEAEIESSASLKIRYFLHNHIVKKMLGLIKTTKKQLNDLLKEEIDRISTSKQSIIYLDISCGDDSSSINIADYIYSNGIVIANDVSWESVERLRKKNNKGLENIFYTNHGASERSYSHFSIDLSICKNTLHHTRDYNELKDLICNLLKITRDTIILIDIENPCTEGGFPYAINAYYKIFLNDKGINFFTEKQFRALFISNEEISRLIRENNFEVDIKIFKAKFGNSMVAILRKISI